MKFSLAGVSLLLLSQLAVQAQTGAGVVRGTVTDTTQAIISGATVALTNKETNIIRKASSSEEGIYVFTGVPRGSYDVAVEAPGFRKYAGTLTLDVGQTAVVDAALQVGSVDTVVEVTAATPVITTESSEIADVKDALRIRQLPLNGRDVTSLFSLTPGVEGGVAPRVNGLKVGATEMLLDGVSIIDRFGGGMARVQPGLDTVQEFRIETTGSSAQYSRPATVTLVTKGGTNEFHGTAFETHRNNFGGLRARQRQNGSVLPKLIRNEYGISAGGPLVLPKLYNGKDKTFWFAAYEGLKQRQEQFQRDSVPLTAMWSGDFSGIVNNAGQRTTIYDPLTTDANGVRQPFANNMIPAERLSPFFRKMQEITARPTNSINPYQGENFDAVYPNTTDVYKITARADHRFSDKDSIMGRYSLSNLSNRRFGGVFGSPPPGTTNGFGSGRQDAKMYNATAQYTHVFTPGILNEFMAGVFRQPKSSGTLADFTDWPGQLGLPNPFGAEGWPTMYTDPDPFAWDADNRKDEKLTAFNIEDNLTWIAGRHSLKFGGKGRSEYNNVRELQQAQGSHEFGSAWTAQYDSAGDQAVSFTGSGLASMALGLSTQLTNQANRGFFYFRQKEIGLYVQDTWKVSQRLTLDLGLRWDYWTPYTEKRNRFVQIDPATIADRFQVVTPGDIPMEEIPGVLPSQLTSWARRGLTWTTANQTGLPSNLLRADTNNFAPRVGLAYKLTDKTVLRASYGEYFWTMPLSQILQTMRTTPPLNLRYTNDLGTLDGTDSFGVRTRPQTNFFIGQGAGVDTNGIVTISPGAQGGLLIDGNNWKDAHARSMHFTIERTLMANTALRLSYIGERARDLEQRYSINQREAEFNYVARTGQNPPGNRDLLRVNPNWNLSAVNRTGYSNSHLLQAEVERRYANGLAFQWFYTFSRSLTTTDADGSVSGNGAINATNGVTQVPESIQLLGAPQISYDDRLRLGYANSSVIPAHRIRYNAIYDLPFGRGQKFGSGASGLVNQLIGGWQIAAIGDWRGGNWLSVDAARYLFGDPTLSEDERLRLTFAGRDQRLWFRGDFDPTAATNVDQTALRALVPVDRGQRVLRPLGPGFDNRLPQPLANGTTRLTPITDTVNWNARNFFRGPGAWNLDASLYKNFNFAETKQIRFSADFFNAFNHPVDANPNATTGLQDLSTQTNEPRVIQLSLRVSW